MGKSSPTADDFYDATGGKKLSAKEMRALSDKMQGKVKRSGDIKAGVSDFLNGRKGSQQGIKPGKSGRSIFSKDPKPR